MPVCGTPPHYDLLAARGVGSLGLDQTRGAASEYHCLNGGTAPGYGTAFSRAHPNVTERQTPQCILRHRPALYQYCRAYLRPAEPRLARHWGPFLGACRLGCACVPLDVSIVPSIAPGVLHWPVGPLWRRQIRAEVSSALAIATTNKNSGSTFLFSLSLARVRVSEKCLRPPSPT